MKTFSTEYAAQHLTELLDLAARGELVVLSLNGSPVARLVPIDDERSAEVPAAEVEEAFHGD